MRLPLSCRLLPVSRSVSEIAARREGDHDHRHSLPRFEFLDKPYPPTVFARHG